MFKLFLNAIFINLQYSLVKVNSFSNDMYLLDFYILIQTDVTIALNLF